MQKFKIIYDVQIDDEPKHTLEAEADTFEDAQEIRDDLKGSDYYSNIQIIWPENGDIEDKEEIEKVEIEIKKDTNLTEACEMLELIKENIDNFDDKENMKKEEWESFLQAAKRTGDYNWQNDNIISVSKVLSELFKI